RKTWPESSSAWKAATSLSTTRSRSGSVAKTSTGSAASSSTWLRARSRSWRSVSRTPDPRPSLRRFRIPRMSLDPELLKQAELFSGLDGKEAKKIAPLFKERDFTAGDVMAEEGKHGVGFFLIESGSAKVTSPGEDGTTL